MRIFNTGTQIKDHKYNTCSLKPSNIQGDFYIPKFSNCDGFYKSSNKISFCSIQEDDFCIWRIPQDIKEILSKYESMGVNEYMTMPEQIKNRLKNYKPFSQYDIDDILQIQMHLQNGLDEIFPEGYTLISIGKSPAIFIKVFEFKEPKEINTILCPISNLGQVYDLNKELTPQDVAKYAECLKKIGISKEELAKTERPFVFVDYTKRGKSLKIFEKLMAKDEIGIKGEKCRFLSMNRDILPPEIAKKFKDRFLWMDFKIYSPISTFNYQFLNFENPIEDFLSALLPSIESKIMQFHLIDTLKSKVLIH